MKTFREFISEVNYPEKGSDAEKERWNIGEGYNDTFKVTVYDNKYFQYIPFL